jgi:hypothetical protein
MDVAAAMREDTDPIFIIELQVWRGTMQSLQSLLILFREFSSGNDTRRGSLFHRRNDQESMLFSSVVVYGPRISFIIYITA